MLISAPESMLGTSAMARITSVGRWSVFGEVIETLSSATTNVETQAREESDSITCENCDCSAESCGEEKSGEVCNVSEKISKPDQTIKGFLGWFMRNRNYKREVKSKNEEEKKQELVTHWGLIDRSLVCGVFISSLTILVLLISIASRVLLRQ